MMAMQTFAGAWVINQATKDMDGFRVSNGKTTNAIITHI